MPFSSYGTLSDPSKYSAPLPYAPDETITPTTLSGVAPPMGIPTGLIVSLAAGVGFVAILLAITKE